MVNKKVATLTNSSFGDEDAMEEMCSTMDDLRRHNQILEDNVLHIQQH